MTTAQSEPATPHDPVRGRAINYTRRHATTAGLLLWAAAGTVFAIHATGTGLPDPTRFAMLESWLIGLGCVGCPMTALRAVARRVNLQAFVVVAAFCFALAILLTALFLGGALHFDALNGTFAVILPLAPAIQAANATDGEMHARQREAAACQRGRVEALADAIGQSRAVLAGLDRIEAMSAWELRAVAERSETARCPRREVATVLQLPAPVNGHRRRQRTDMA